MDVSPYGYLEDISTFCSRIVTDAGQNGREIFASFFLEEKRNDIKQW